MFFYLLAHLLIACFLCVVEVDRRCGLYAALLLYVIADMPKSISLYELMC